MASVASVSGEDHVARLLRSAGDHATNLGPAMEDIAHYSEGQITNIPVDTGRLASSVRGGSGQALEVNDDGFDLATIVPYARHVFNGTRHMPARPPKINDTAIARYAEQRITRELT